MSELRNQLDQVRREHQATRYPGDLAADTLGVPPTRLGYASPPRRHWLFWTNLGTLGAVAATVALVLWRVQPTGSIVDRDNANPIHIISVWTPPDDKFTIVPQLAGATLTPPAGETAFPAMPSFPSMTDVLNSATPTTDTTNTNQENT